MKKREPIYRVLKSNMEDTDILYTPDTEVELFVYIIGEPYWQYNLIDELEQLQVFPKKLKYLKTNCILELHSVNLQNNSIYYVPSLRVK
jgi:hypothetical protein